MRFIVTTLTVDNKKVFVPTLKVRLKDVALYLYIFCILSVPETYYK